MHQINKLFGEKLHMVNIGVETFYQDMLSQKEAGTQDIEVIHVDWKPVAGGNCGKVIFLNNLFRRKKQ